MTRPEIGLLHFRIFRHRRVITLGQNLAPRQHGDRVGEIGDDVEIVFDHENGAVGGDALHELGDIVDVFVPHACHRFVEQHHFGIERQAS